jgi:hypothetical protein
MKLRLYTYIRTFTNSLSAMPGLSYPFVYECSSCGTETTVTREDARGLYPDPDSPNAVDIVLQERGWMRGKME